MHKYRYKYRYYTWKFIIFIDRLKHLNGQIFTYTNFRWFSLQKNQSLLWTFIKYNVTHINTWLARILVCTNVDNKICSFCKQHRIILWHFFHHLNDHQRVIGKKIFSLFAHKKSEKNKRITLSCCELNAWKTLPFRGKFV